MSATSESKIPTTAHYGAAMTGMFVLTAPASAAIVGLDFSPVSLPFSSTTFTTYAFDAVEMRTDVGSGLIGSFGQFNDLLGKSVIAGSVVGPGGVDLLGPLSTGNPVSALQSFLSTGIGFGTSASGTNLFGFRTTDNRFGWLRLDFGGSGGPVSYLDGAFNTTTGQGIVAGSLTAVPEPGSAALMGLTALAAGATALRRKKKRVETASTE